MNPLDELHRLEIDARRMRAQVAGDALARAAIAVDLAIRRAAWRLLTLAGAGRPAPH